MQCVETVVLKTLMDEMSVKLVWNSVTHTLPLLCGLLTTALYKFCFFFVFNRAAAVSKTHLSKHTELNPGCNVMQSTGSSNSSIMSTQRCSSCQQLHSCPFTTFFNEQLEHVHLQTIHFEWLWFPGLPWTVDCSRSVVFYVCIKIFKTHHGGQK